MDLESCARLPTAEPCPACSEVALHTTSSDALFHSMCELVDALHVRRSVYAILDVGESPRYAQVISDSEGALLVEASSNEATARACPPAGLTVIEEIELLRLGYRPPDDWSPNWHRVFAQPWPWPAPVVAELMIRTLLDVLGARPSDLAPRVEHAVTRFKIPT